MQPFISQWWYQILNSGGSPTPVGNAFLIDDANVFDIDDETVFDIE